MTDYLQACFTRHVLCETMSFQLWLSVKCYIAELVTNDVGEQSSIKSIDHVVSDFFSDRAWNLFSTQSRVSVLWIMHWTQKTPFSMWLAFDKILIEADWRMGNQVMVDFPLMSFSCALNLPSWEPVESFEKTRCHILDWKPKNYSKFFECGARIKV